MDKFEFDLKINQIKKMNDIKDYLTVTEIADNIDMRKVKDYGLIYIVSDAYKETSQLGKAKDVLLSAYDRSPLGRQLAYRLTLISVDLGELDEAIEYFNDFTDMAPKDIGRYILKYEIAKARGDSKEELIKILEVYVSFDLDEKWQFTLAELYHQTRQSQKCVEQCNEIILWFNEGKYVEKAMELKILYQPLSDAQQEQYDNIQKKKEDPEKKISDIEVMPEKPIFDSSILGDPVLEDPVLEDYVLDEPILEESMAEEPILEEPILEEPTIEEIPSQVPLEDNYNLLFEEEVDGQLGLYLEETKNEEQIEGQLTIEDLIVAGTEETEDLEVELADEIEPLVLDEEYRQVFERYLPIENVEHQLAEALDKLINNFDHGGTSEKNNVIIIGDSKTGRTTLAIELIKIVNRKRGRKGRKIVKIRGGQLNNKGLENAISKLLGADLIIEQAANMSSTTIENLEVALKGFTQDMIVVFEDNNSAIDRLLNANKTLINMFENVINIHGFCVKDWAEKAKEYANEKGYEIDEMGILALHVKIGNLCSTCMQVEKQSINEIIDEAINKNQKSRRFKLFKKDTSLILRESDFI